MMRVIYKLVQQRNFAVFAGQRFSSQRFFSQSNQEGKNEEQKEQQQQQQQEEQKTKEEKKETDYEFEEIQSLETYRSIFDPIFEEAFGLEFPPKDLKKAFSPEWPQVPFHMVEYNGEKYETKSYNLLSEYFQKKNAIIIGSLGAFVPEDVKIVLPDWNKGVKVFKKKYNFDDIIVLTNNDPFVLQRFAEKLDYKDKFKFLSDWDGRISKELYLYNDMRQIWMGYRNKRFTLVVRNGAIKIVYLSGIHSVRYMYSVTPDFLYRMINSPRHSIRIFR